MSQEAKWSKRSGRFWAETPVENDWSLWWWEGRLTELSRAPPSVDSWEWIAFVVLELPSEGNHLGGSHFVQPRSQEPPLEEELRSTTPSPELLRPLARPDASQSSARVDAEGCNRPTRRLHVTERAGTQR